MNKKNKVSVIIPVFNTSNFLNKCLQSVLKQTYTNLEIICVNDGSTDDSQQKCEHYANQDKRIVVVNKENGGLSSARNAGLKIATGKFIIFIDSDDFVEPNMIEKLVDIQLKTNCDICICSFLMETEKGAIYAETPTLENKTYCNAEAMQLLNQPRQDRFVVSWNKLYKKELFNEIEFPVGKIHEDQWIAHKLFYASKIISTCSDKLYHYIIHDNSIMQSSNPIKHFDDIDALFDRIKFYQSKSLHSLIEGTILTMCSVFSFYREKIWAYENFKLNELKNIFKQCKTYVKQLKTLSANEEKIKIFKFCFLDKLKLFYKNKLKVKKWKIKKSQ